jgi:vacuolar-type H+-ATPase subunit H
MSRESILKIRETEERAAQTVDAAKARARETVERAEREGRELCDRTEAEAMAQYTEVIQKIRERSLVLAEKNQTETNEEIAKLRREVSLRRKIAEKIIIRGLESKCR